MTGLPAGTVTLLFSDIEGSTRLLLRLGTQYPAVLEEHRRLLSSAIQAADGSVVDTQGDACFAVFSRASDGVAAAVAMQRALAAHAWPGDVPVRVRIGIHTGEPTLTAGGYTGLDVHRAARICSAGHGGQILLSSTTADLVAGGLSPDLQLAELGSFRFKDFNFAERVYQLNVADLPTEVRSLRTLEAATHLPEQHHPLVGRDEEIAVCRGLLLDPHTRLVTLTGPGGTGKTRLAIATASSLESHFADGVCFVSLYAVTHPDAVASTIARALGVRDAAPRSWRDVLLDVLNGRELLLVLDNFEQVLDAAPIVSDLLAHCAGLKVLVTSRELLHLSGEREHGVPPLDLPPADTEVVGDLLEFPAVRLFVERARAANPGLTLTDADAPAIAEICRRLDGLPLAIELASARTRYLSIAALRARLDRRLALLTGGPRDVPARQQTLRGAIAWSHDLLTERDRAVFRRASVFVSGWTLDAAEAVCALEGDPFGTIEALASLVDKSLVRREDLPDGDARFSMLETIREFAAERLTMADEYEETSRRHAEHFLALAEEAEPHLGVPESQLAWLERLNLESGNLEVVFEWCRASHASPERASIGLRLGAALWRFWAVRSSASEARARVEAILALAPAGRGSLAHAMALQGAAVLARELADYDDSHRLMHEALAIARTAGQHTLVAEILNDLGWLSCLNGVSDLARAQLDEGLAIFRELGDVRQEAIVLSRIGYVEFTDARYEEACRLGDESLALARRSGDLQVVVEALLNAGVAYQYSGNLERARRLCEEALQIASTIRDRQNGAVGTYFLAQVCVSEGKLGEAASLFRETLITSREIGNRRRLAFSLSSMSLLAAARGEAERALRLAGTYEAASEAMGAVRARPAQRIAEEEAERMRAILGEATAAAAREIGRAQPLDDAVDEALAWLGAVIDAESPDQREATRWLASPWTVLGWSPGEPLEPPRTELRPGSAVTTNGGAHHPPDAPKCPSR